eukprot:5541021-Amphidinium_carterae.1
MIVWEGSVTARDVLSAVSLVLFKQHWKHRRRWMPSLAQDFWEVQSSMFPKLLLLTVGTLELDVSILLYVFSKLTSSILEWYAFVRSKMASHVSRIRLCCPDRDRKRLALLARWTSGTSSCLGSRFVLKHSYAPLSTNSAESCFPLAAVGPEVLT